MSNLIPVDEQSVFERKGRPVTNSVKVAQYFGKRHNNVMRDIRESECSDDFRALNFEQSSYVDEQGKRQPMFNMTKDGFFFIAMGFTGKKAAIIKETYINRFNQMEQFIQSLQSAKLEFPAFTAAIMMAHEEPKNYHFSNELNMINKIVLGMDTKHFKIDRGLDLKTPSIRPFLSLEEIKSIEMLQRVDIGLQISTPDYKERKRLLTECLERSRVKAISA